LVPGYYSQAFIKEFTAGYGFVGMTIAPLSNGATFDVQRAIGAGNIAQYGFMTVGPNARLTDDFGSAVVTVIPEPSSVVLVLSGLAGLITVGRRNRRR
jgi:hypothetical protein